MIDPNFAIRLTQEILYFDANCTELILRQNQREHFGLMIMFAVTWALLVILYLIIDRKLQTFSGEIK